MISREVFEKNIGELSGDRRKLNNLGKGGVARVLKTCLT